MENDRGNTENKMFLRFQATKLINFYTHLRSQSSADRLIFSSNSGNIAHKQNYSPLYIANLLAYLV